ncbi:MAG: adenine phosphoribosyltransferase [Clostridia bacterium]|nr:adenine phosphoribosyltransferase [Clostridia bacterium]MBQ3939055.1 adenine phosphoribosyltransferase [Clostridia bacterium]MBQ5487626.1 adenine phosphoribosyltransferase [Clostridia bacterium]MBR4636689.1 adenine phosphoribosyltransferase [Clostridia bacterium]
MLNEQELKDTIRSIPDYPIEGVLFRDITTLVKNPEAYHDLITTIADQLRELNVDIVIGPEARGFVIGSAVAYALGAGFVLARKPGKLPCEVYSINYGLEYGSDRLEIHKDAVQPGQRVAIVDDLLATGGTARAAVDLVREVGGEVVAAAFAIELSDLGGRAKLGDCPVIAAMTY